MILFPAIDLLGSKAVRLYKGDYNQVTVYDENPVHTAEIFKQAGAKAIHIVDLDGARDGSNENLAAVIRIKKQTDLFCEIGGGIRTMESAEKYISAGMDRIILGTAALTNPEFVKEAVAEFGKKVSVGIDLRNGMVAVKGWKEDSSVTADEMIKRMTDIGVKHFIITDISKDGAMQGTATELYRRLSQQYDADITASGGVSSIDDVRALRSMKLYGAIIGKAYYTGAIDLKEAIKEANA